MNQKRIAQAFNKKQPECMVISDSSQNQPRQGFYPKQNQSIVRQRPIRQMTYEQRLADKIVRDKPSKKVKLDEDSVPIIRFDSIKFDDDEFQKKDQDPSKKLKIKMKKAIPWISKQTKQIEDACLRFHNQIVEFYHYIKPSKKEHESRLKVFNLLKQMIVEKYPKADVKYFGSFATKLYLPDGDIDVTVLIDCEDNYEQRKIYDSIHRIIKKHEGSLFCDIQYIRNSKVPLIKFLHVDTQFQFDVSVNKTDGLRQIEHVQRIRRIYPQFEPLVYLFKTTLKIRKMSETYTGGIGSFLLFCMILHFLRKTHQKQTYYTMGQYAMKFMQFYGIMEWDRKSVYVSDSSEVGRARQPGTLSFFSPQDESHDIGKSAYKIKDAFNVFKNRFRTISGKNFKSEQSILKQLINPNLEQFRYYKYERQQNKSSN